jgi:hypothetical protein
MQGQIVNWGQAISSLNSTFMSFNMAISSFSTFMEKMQDPDASGWEKLSSGMMAASMAMMTLTSGWGLLTKAISLNEIASRLHLETKREMTD